MTVIKRQLPLLWPSDPKTCIPGMESTSKERKSAPNARSSLAASSTWTESVADSATVVLEVALATRPAPSTGWTAGSSGCLSLWYVWVEEFMRSWGGRQVRSAACFCRHLDPDCLSRLLVFEQVIQGELSGRSRSIFRQTVRYHESVAASNTGSAMFFLAG